MKCNECGFETKDTAKFCSKCGKALRLTPEPPKENNNSKIIIAALVIVIVILAVTFGYFALNNNSNNSAPAQSNSQSSGGAANNGTTQQTDSSQSSSQPKEWKLIGSYSGSGSGSQSISVPAGQIMIKISAYPIKNYATNHLYVTGPSGKAGVDWGSTSAVETRSDSVSFNSSSAETFTIDYYETVSWKVEFYRYQ